MAKPRFGQRSIGGIVGGEFANHARLGAGMGEHVDEVEHDDVEVVLLKRIEVAEQALSGGSVVDFVVGKSALTAEAFKLSLNQGRLVEVFALLALLIDPHLREHALNLRRHQTGEDGVAGILSGRGED